MTFFFHYLTYNRISKRRKSLKSVTNNNNNNGNGSREWQRKDLPPDIVIEILSKLPLKSILISRCVCKTWQLLISDPEFARLHFNRSNVELFLRTDHSTCISGTLHWVDPETIPIEADSSCNRQETKIDVSFYLPKRYRHTDKDKKTSNLTEGDYVIVNSCNGLLCLSKSLFGNPCILCNPITGEYITIPKPQKDESNIRNVVSGFGYSLRSKQYKVLRMAYVDNSLNRVAEVYTLGTLSWRRIGYGPSVVITGLFATYLNGVIHWVCNDVGDHSSDFIMAFDFDDERFCVVPAPLHFGEMQKKTWKLYNMNMGVLGGCLSICDCTNFVCFDIWVMKDYGVQESWTKQFVINNKSPGPCQLLKYMDNGDVLMFYRRRALAVYNPVENKFRYLLIHEAQSIVFEAITLTPSFLSFKDAVGGDNLKVQNVRSRCLESEQQEEAETLFLVETEISKIL